MRRLEIYIDVLIVENLVINYLILLVTSKFLRIKAKEWRLFLSAGIGTVYVVIMLVVPNASFYFTLFGKICLSILMILSAYSVKSWRMFGKITICFYISTFLFAGAAFAYVYMSGSGGFVQNGVYYIFQKNNTNLLVFSGVLAFIIIRIFYRALFRKGSDKNDLVSFRIAMDGKELELKGLVDTGNGLYDPLTHLPVIVCELQAVQDMVPALVAEMVRTSDLTRLERLEGHPWFSKIRLVPYSALGTEKGMLLGFKPDSLWVCNAKGEKGEPCVAVVCLYDKALSANESYHALLSPDLIIVS